MTEERRNSDTTSWANPFWGASMPQALAGLLGWSDVKKRKLRRWYIIFWVRPCVRQLTPKQLSRRHCITHNYTHQMYVDERDSLYDSLEVDELTEMIA